MGLRVGFLWWVWVFVCSFVVFVLLCVLRVRVWFEGLCFCLWVCVFVFELGCVGSVMVWVLLLWLIGYFLDFFGVFVDVCVCLYICVCVVVCFLFMGFSYVLFGLRIGKIYFILVVVILVLSVWLVFVDMLKWFCESVFRICVNYF